MISKHNLKIYKSLDKKKYRQKYNLFLVEGHKIINEFINSPFKIQKIYSCLPDLSMFSGIPTEPIDAKDLAQMSLLMQPKDGIALLELAPNKEIKTSYHELVLDNLQDPGNLGAIIRLADWFGIEQIICSPDCVDVYNPKVIQASKGSLARVNVFYTDLPTYLNQKNTPIITTDMQGESIYQYEFPSKAYIVLGNEGQGVSEAMHQMAQQKITIPRFGKTQATESLNVATASAIILGQIFGNVK